MGKNDKYSAQVLAILIADDIKGTIKHKLVIDTNTGVSIAVLNGATPVADGAEVASGIALTITATVSDGYSLPILDVNRQPFTSGGKHTVEADGGEDVVAYAFATPNTYAITYMDGETALTLAPATYTTDLGATLSETAPDKTGFTFSGWYSEAALTNVVTAVSTATLGDQTFYAKYTANTYDLTETDTEASTGTIVLKDDAEATVTAGTDALTYGETYSITITPANATTFTAAATNNGVTVELTDTEGVFTGTFVCAGDVVLSIVAVETGE